MPIYEYDCSACGERFEQLVTGSDPATVCPRCGAEAPRRRLSVFAVGRTEHPRPRGCGTGDCACGAECD